jgi:putative ABC transport system substrate-binding protein
MVEGAPTFWSSFLKELRRLGHVEGQTVVLDRWAASGVATAEAYTALARRVVASEPRVIVARGLQMLVHVAAATRQVPIVAIATIPPELRASLARPGANVTGIHLSFEAQQLYRKQIEVLRDVLKPGARIAWLGSQVSWQGPIGEAARTGAADAKVTLQPIYLTNPINRATVRRAFADIGRARVDGLLISPSVELFPYRGSVAELAAAQKLPTLGASRYWAEAGAMLGYGIDYDETFRRAASYVDRILKGADPAVMPIQQPDKVELVVNLETARSIGVAIPQSMLLRADKVIE